MAMDEDFRRAALDYHRLPRPGKLTIEPTKRMATQRDLALAYSPGVAAACEEIRADPGRARDYTTRGNLVGVISNGTAVLGLGNIGALAGKPVMEGKAVLFKKFADDRRVSTSKSTSSIRKRFIEVVSACSSRRSAAINLEDIKAPECFDHRDEAASQADEHPGVPRRPARHRDRVCRRECSNVPRTAAASGSTEIRSW